MLLWQFQIEFVRGCVGWRNNNIFSSEFLWKKAQNKNFPVVLFVLSIGIWKKNVKFLTLGSTKFQWTGNRNKRLPWNWSLWHVELQRYQNKTKQRNTSRLFSFLPICVKFPCWKLQLWPDKPMKIVALIFRLRSCFLVFVSVARSNFKSYRCYLLVWRFTHFTLLATDFETNLQI